MRIKKIEFENFRNYRDRGSISFPTDGRISVLYGPNGVGKTTLLKILAGLLQPKTGEEGNGVFIDGVPVREKSGDIAFISEAGSYLKDLTPKEFGGFLADFYPDFDRE